MEQEDRKNMKTMLNIFYENGKKFNIMFKGLENTPQVLSNHVK
jgi:hypothetical protein